MSDDLVGLLPPDAEPGQSADEVRIVTGNRPVGFCQFSRKLPAKEIRDLLQRLADNTGFTSVFLRACMDPEESDGALREHWKAALDAVQRLNTAYAWTSAKKRARLEPLARDPRHLEAIRAIAVGCKAVPLDALAVLALDGSEASVDALLPHFVHATGVKDRTLDLLAKVKAFASPTPAVQKMLESVSATLTERRAASPALEWAKRIGLGALGEVWFQASFESRNRDDLTDLPCRECRIVLDSREPCWFTTTVQSNDAGSPMPTTVLEAGMLLQDELGLGSCEPAELPVWLGRSIARSGDSWDFARLWLKTNLRGQGRKRLVRWLTGD